MANPDLKESIFDPTGMDRTPPGMWAIGYEKVMHDLVVLYGFAGGKLERSAYPVIVCNWSATREQPWMEIGMQKGPTSGVEIGA